MSENKKISIMKFEKPLDIPKFTGPKTQRKKAVRKVNKKRLIGIIFAAGLAGAGIGKIAEKINNGINTKEAIITAVEADKYYENIMQNEKTPEEFSQKINEFEKNLNLYEELSNKDTISAQEEANLLQAEVEMANNYSNIVELRTASLKNEIAQAEGITSPKEISQIEITCKWNSTGNEEKDIAIHEIRLPDGTIYTTDSMDKKLQEEIEDIKKPMYNYGKNLKDATVLSKDELKEYVEEEVKYYKNINYLKENNLEKKNNILGSKLVTQKDNEEIDR